MKPMSRIPSPAAGLAVLAIVAATFVPVPSSGEYGDIVLNNYSTARGMDPVLFSHSIHRMKYRCQVCHGELGFEMRARANQIDMAAIADGKFCGGCHNGRIAWSPVHCDRCHVPNASRTAR